MGPKGLGKLIKSRSPRSIVWEKNLRGKKMTIDARLLLYTVMISTRGKNDGMDIITSSGRVSSHIHGIYNWIMNLIEYEIEAVWIFDGPPPDIKKGTLKKRAMIKQKARQELCEDIEHNMSLEEVIKRKKKTVDINDRMRDEVQELLALFGVPYLNALSEGEMQCAAFGKTHWTISEDWDALVFGSSNMIKQISFSKNMFVRISLRNLLDDLGLTHQEFIELCIFMGCDYCPKINGIDFEVYDVYKLYKNPEQFIQYLEDMNSQHIQETGKVKYIIPNDYITTFNEAKSFYLEGPIINPESNKLRLNWKQPDYEGLISFLCDKFELDYDLVSRDINHVRKMYNKYSNFRQRQSVSYSNHFNFIKSRQ